MPLFYLDVETEGQDPQQDRLVAVQLQPLGDDFRPVGPLTVLVEWEWGEKEILRSVLAKGLLDPTWDFVPVGNHLRFGLTFLMERAQRFQLRDWTAADLRRFWFEKPMLDLAPLLVLMNAGRFEGSSIDAYVEKRPSADVPVLYRLGQYKEILEHVHEEGKATLGLLGELRAMLATFGDRKRAAR